VLATVAVAMSAADKRPSFGGYHVEEPEPSYQAPQRSYEVPDRDAYKPTYSAPRPSYHSEEKGMPFNYQWAVNDEYSGNQYNHDSQSDGKVTEGEYRVLLPDGRTQIVKYTADHYNGFQAEVTYEGEARPYEAPPHTYEQPQRTYEQPQRTYEQPQTTYGH